MTTFNSGTKLLLTHPEHEHPVSTGQMNIIGAHRYKLLVIISQIFFTRMNNENVQLY